MLGGGAALMSQPAPREQVGPMPDGRFSAEQRLAYQSRGHADSGRHIPDGDGHHARQEASAGAEWRLQSAEHQRHRYRQRKGSEPHAGARWLARPDDDAKPETRFTWAAGRRAAIYEFSLANGVLTAVADVPGRRGERPQAGGLHRRRSVLRPTGTCSTPRICITIPSWW